MAPARSLLRIAEGFGFGECPRWHDDRLWLSDQEDGKVLAVSADGTVEVVADVPGTPSGLGWLPDGTLLVVSMVGQCLLALRDGVPETYAELAHLVPGECNELVVDGFGRAYVGNVGFDYRAVPFSPQPTTLVLVAPGTEPRAVGGELLVPNGSVVTPDGGTLIVAETLASKLTAFAVDEDGTLSEQRSFADLPGRRPDGICLDAEGCVWIADSGSTSFLRVREGGEIVDEVDAGRPPYACMLGGPAGTMLFMVTAEGHDAESKARHTSAVDAVEVDVPRAGWP